MNSKIFKRFLTISLTILMLINACALSSLASDNTVVMDQNVLSCFNCMPGVNDFVVEELDSVQCIDRACATFSDVPQSLSNDEVDWTAVKETLAQGFDSFSASIEIYSFSIPHNDANILKLFDIIHHQMPEYFLIKFNTFSVWKGMLYSIQPVYPAETASEYRAMRNEFFSAADEILSGIEGNNKFDEITKALLVHDRLIERAEYDYKDYVADSLPDIYYTAYGIMVDRMGVCMGYANAYLYLLNRLGIECSIASSTMFNHAWNIVTIKERNNRGIVISETDYYVDVTSDDLIWDIDGRVNHDFFLVSYETYVKAKRWDDGYSDMNKFYNAQDFYDKTTEDITDKSHENDFWVNSHAAFQLLNNEIYYIDFNAETINRYSDKAKIHSISDVWQGSANSYWSENYSRLATDGKHLYYSMHDKIYRYDLGTRKATVIYTPDVSMGKYFSIYGFTYYHGLFVYDLFDSPTFDSETKQMYHYTFSLGGSCGKNVKWAFDNGVLTISGSGAMYDYYDYESGDEVVPWYEFRNEIKSVKIGDNITNIGRAVFCDHTNLESVTIGKNVSAIGNTAFAFCTSLKRVDIPASVKTIGDTAFHNCTSLSTVTLNKGLTSIGISAFANCTTISDVVVPDGVTSIGRYAFYRCTGLKKVTLPNSVKNIGPQAFYLNDYYMLDAVICYRNSYAASFANANRIAVEYIETPYMSASGVNISVNNLYDVKDFFIAKGKNTTYQEIKNNGYVVRVTEAKINEHGSYSYPVKEEGIYTVYVRYKDSDRSDYYEYITVDVQTPTYAQNGLQLTVGNLKGVKAIRTAEGYYSSVSDIKKAAGYRTFTQSMINGSDDYTIQYRDGGVITVAVQYTNGYTEIKQFLVEKKTPAITKVGNTVIFSGLDDLYVIRYAEGKYNSSADIKRAEGSKFVKSDMIDENGEVVLTLDLGLYSFCVQYNDESYNYYTIVVE